MTLYHRSQIRKLFNDGIGFVGSFFSTTTTGIHTQQVSNSASVDQPVLLIIHCTETFANGSGAKPVFSIGQTGSATKFVGTATIAALTIGQKIVVVGTLTAADDIIVTATVATGTATGAIKITSQIFPATMAN